MTALAAEDRAVPGEYQRVMKITLLKHPYHLLWLPERWKDILSLEGRYQVSTKGRVRSMDRHTPMGRGVRFSKGQILKPKVDKYGYLVIGIWIDRKKKHFTVHRLVAKTFIPNPNNLPAVNHKWCDKKDNRIGSLEWCNNYDNIQHAKENGRIQGIKGGKHYKAKPIIDLSTGVFYDSTKEAAEAIGMNRATLKDYLGRYSHRNTTSLKYA